MVGQDLLLCYDNRLVEAREEKRRVGDGQPAELVVSLEQVYGMNSEPVKDSGVSLEQHLLNLRKILPDKDVCTFYNVVAARPSLKLVRAINHDSGHNPHFIEKFAATTSHHL